MTASSTFWQLLASAEVAPQKSQTLFEAFGSSLTLTPHLFAQHPVLSPGESKRVLECSLAALEAGLKNGAQILEFTDFPLPLKEATDSPMALFCKGDMNVLQSPCVNIVGTRNASTYGRAVAKKFAEYLANAGLTIVSGGALGIDAATHEGAINAGGKTIAVMGGGLDRLYPAMHHSLFRKIEQSGALVSTYPFGVQALPHRFLQRNWLISALSLATIVIEAPSKSGSLKTASDAAELGRPVLVVPSGIENFNFRGSHALIRDGATLVDHPDQVLEAINWKPSKPAPQPVLFTDAGNRILASLETSSLRPEVIAERSGLTTSELLSELTILELEGKVIRDGGGYALVP